MDTTIECQFRSVCLGGNDNKVEHQGSAYVRTEHILLGIVRDGGGIGADMLDTLGVLGKVRAQVFELLG